jgi:hypothetical protein
LDLSRGFIFELKNQISNCKITKSKFKNEQKKLEARSWEKKISSPLEKTINYKGSKNKKIFYFFKLRVGR